jgi:hypothetical protein
MAQKVDPLPSAVLRRICAVLGDTATGLTGRQIAELLHDARIDDPGEITKRDRLFEALHARQVRDGAANAVLACLQLALSPARFLDDPARFDTWREQISQTLAFEALAVGEDGNVRRLEKAATALSEARGIIQSHIV